MQVCQNYLLKEYNTFGIAAAAKYFVSFSSVEELEEVLDNNKNIPFKMILGGGSNILFTRDYNGLVLKNTIPGIKVLNEDNEYIYVNAGAGIKWHDLVLFCVKNNYAGMENLSLIPGNVGASPMQNIGAYGVEVKDIFYELEAFHLEDKTVIKFSAKDCEFGYRDSIFKRQLKGQFAILNVTYRLKKNPVFNVSYGTIEKELEKMKMQELSIKAISDAVIHIRTSKLPDPAVIGNAGSFFKNPVIGKSEFKKMQDTEKDIPYYEAGENKYKIPAGWLIEQCGWKGYRKGDAGCYEKQALVLVNYGNATGKEIYNLSEEIKISVQEKFGIELEREVNVA
jgi:UDP-N-acetylmuramate dehydrogenase